MNEKVHDYHDGNRQFQDRFDTRRLADHLTGRVTETIGESQKEFIEKADMFFLATCDHRGCLPAHTRVETRGSCEYWTRGGSLSRITMAMGNFNPWVTC